MGSSNIFITICVDNDSMIIKSFSMSVSIITISNFICWNLFFMSS